MDTIKKLRVKISMLKGNLARTDYQAIKYAEGLISEEEYAPIKAQRQEWRDEINALQQQIKSLREANNGAQNN